jgi:hypothetical protein
MVLEMRDVDLQESEPIEAPESSTEKQVEVPEQEETQVEEAEEQAPAQEEQQTAQEEPAKPIANKTNERIRNLANENRELKAKLEEFKTQPAPELDGDMTVDDLNVMVNERALEAAKLIAQSSQVEVEFKQQVTNWANDFEQVKASNPALDPKSPDYDAELDQTLARLLDDGHGNPRVDIMVSDVLKTLNKRESTASAKAQEAGKSQATATLAKQMAEGAITPMAKSSPDAEELSEQEMAELRVSNPKEWLNRL